MMSSGDRIKHFIRSLTAVIGTNDETTCTAAGAIPTNFDASATK